MNCLKPGITLVSTATGMHALNLGDMTHHVYDSVSGTWRELPHLPASAFPTPRFRVYHTASVGDSPILLRSDRSYSVFYQKKWLTRRLQQGAGPLKGYVIAGIGDALWFLNDVGRESYSYDLQSLASDAPVPQVTFFLEMGGRQFGSRAAAGRGCLYV